MILNEFIDSFMNISCFLIVELEKQSYCDLKVTNNTEHHVAFKVGTITLSIIVIYLHVYVFIL